MCYSDMPYLYTERGFAERHWPYTDDEAVRSEFEVMEYPTGIAYWAWGTSYVTWWLSGSPADDEPGRDLPAEGTLLRRGQRGRLHPDRADLHLAAGRGQPGPAGRGPVPAAGPGTRPASRSPRPWC